MRVSVPKNDSWPDAIESVRAHSYRHLLRRSTRQIGPRPKHPVGNLQRARARPGDREVAAGPGDAQNGSCLWRDRRGRVHFDLVDIDIAIGNFDAQSGRLDGGVIGGRYF